MLRRFLDEALKRSRPGRPFIRVYYGLSPALVRRFGGSAAFRRFWRRLDALRARPRRGGAADAPYSERRRSAAVLYSKTDMPCPSPPGGGRAL